MELIERVPYEATADRPSWAELPEAVRARIVARAGHDVVRASLAGAGFTRGFAGVLTLADGSEVFVKAASEELPVAPHSYRAEAQILPALPAAVPAPRLRWVDDGDGWVVLGLDAVAGARLPALPWQLPELEQAVGVCESTAAALTPAPVGLELPVLVPEYDQESVERGWFGKVARGEVDGHRLSGWACGRLDLLDGLVATCWQAVAGDAACHGDLRPDNIVVGSDGRMWICDWNWLSLGAPWTDLVGLLLTAHPDGHDVDAVWRASTLSAGVDDDAVDAWLALVGAFMLAQADLAPPELASSWLTKHRLWFGAAAMSWLESRRGGIR